MTGKRGNRYDKRRDVDLVRDAATAERDAERAAFGSKRPPRHAVKAADEFLRKRDPWDEIKTGGES